MARFCEVGIPFPLGKEAVNELLLSDSDLWADVVDGTRKKSTDDQNARGGNERRVSDRFYPVAEVP